MSPLTLEEVLAFCVGTALRVSGVVGFVRRPFWLDLTLGIPLRAVLRFTAVVGFNKRRRGKSKRR